MKKFRFSLQTVLDYRELLVETLTRELSIAQEEKDVANRLLGKLFAALDICRNEYREEKKKPISIEYLRSYQEYIDSINFSISEQKERVRRAEMKVEEKRKDLVAATKKKKVLERIKEKQKTVYLKTLDKWEQHFFDEISQHRFIVEKV